MNKLPADIRSVVDRITLDTASLADFQLLAKFTAAHRSHRKGPMPTEITECPDWNHPEVKKIRSATKPKIIIQPGVKPVTKPAAKPFVKAEPKAVAVIKARVKKRAVSTKGSRYGMGRGVK